MANFDHDNVVPYKDSALDKKGQVAEMFNDISGKYDLLNRLLSGGIDLHWRKKALSHLKSIKPQNLLDVATGTADVAIMAHKQLKIPSIIGIDISDGMLDLGRKKIKSLGFENNITLHNGDSEAIKHPDNSFDAVTVAFGVRNFQQLEKGLSEILRVLKPGGKLMVLEFSRPKNALVKKVYDLYMKVITPKVGHLVSNNREAYAYLDESIRKFPEGQRFTYLMNQIGFHETYYKPLSFGICTIYCGSKKA
jgi:demethylmenaquinone methyltransferase/2-methoxy-6-polyprenyl-1,4-benzoquinol methylase